MEERLVIIFNSRYIVLEMVDKQDRLKRAFREGIAPQEKRRICIIKLFGRSLIFGDFLTCLIWDLLLAHGARERLRAGAVTKLIEGLYITGTRAHHGYRKVVDHWPAR